MRRISIVAGYVIFGLATACVAQQSEKLTITTYYPSPTGVYQTLRVAPGSNPNDCSAEGAPEGKMYYDAIGRVLNICSNSTTGVWGYTPVPGAGGPWALNGEDIINTNSGEVLINGTARIGPNATGSARIRIGELSPSNTATINLLEDTYLGGKGIRIQYNNLSSHSGYERATIDVKGRSFAIRGVDSSVAGEAGQANRIFLNLTTGNVGIGAGAPAELLTVGKGGLPGSEYFYVNTNNGGVAPPAGFGLKVGTNYWGGGGGRDVDFWNSDPLAGRAFTFYQKTAGAPIELMNIMSNGNVGIGTSNPADKLDVNGNVNIIGNCNATAFFYSSDRALKTNIRTARNSLEKVRSLTGTAFNWKKDGRPDLGFIAQEVERVYPELVATDSITGLKSVEYGNLIAPLVEAIKEQQSQIEDLRTEVRRLRSQMETGGVR